MLNELAGIKDTLLPDLEGGSNLLHQLEARLSTKDSATTRFASQAMEILLEAFPPPQLTEIPFDETAQDQLKHLAAGSVDGDVNGEPEPEPQLAEGESMIEDSAEQNYLAQLVQKELEAPVFYPGWVAPVAGPVLSSTSDEDDVPITADEGIDTEEQNVSSLTGRTRST
jgi:hypothetical protein